MFRRCPEGKLLVVYTYGGPAAFLIDGGWAFVWPIIQGYAHLDLRTYTVDGVSAGIGSTPALREAAAIHLVKLPEAEVEAKFRTIVVSTDTDNLPTALAEIGFELRT